MDVFVHVGGIKTGTSAVQSALAANRDALKVAGLFYPPAPRATDERAARGEITSGNATRLACLVRPRLRGPGFSAAQILGELDKALAEAAGRPVLYSTEALHALKPEQIEELDAIFRERGATLKVIYYVRHLLDHSAATYCQMAKVAGLSRRAQEKRSLDHFISRHVNPMHAHLASYAKVLGRERVICRLYDAERQALVPGLLDAVAPGLGLASVLSATSRDRIVNRSPTDTELALFLALNNEPDARELCFTLKNALLNAPPAVPEPLRISQDAFDGFEALNTGHVEAINRDFLPKETPIRLSSGGTLIGSPAGRDPARSEASLHAAIIALARRAEVARRRPTDAPE